MIRFLGMGLVFLAFAGTGYGMARGANAELQIAEQLLELIRKIGSEVRCYKRPLPDIYKDFQSEYLGDFLKELNRNGAKEAFAKLAVDPAVSKACLPFFEEIGKCSAQECELLEKECDRRLTELIAGMAEQMAQKTKVYRSLGLAGGTVAVILLI